MEVEEVAPQVDGAQQSMEVEGVAPQVDGAQRERNSRRVSRRSLRASSTSTREMIINKSEDDTKVGLVLQTEGRLFKRATIDAVETEDHASKVETGEPVVAGETIVAVNGEFCSAVRDTYCLSVSLWTSQVTPEYAMPRYATLRHATPRQATPHHTTHATPHHTTPHHRHASAHRRGGCH